MDATNIPFEEEFDVIGAFDVLEHIEDDERAVAEIWKALKPGGAAIISVPQHMFLWSRSVPAEFRLPRFPGVRDDARRRAHAMACGIRLPAGGSELIVARKPI